VRLETIVEMMDSRTTVIASAATGPRGPQGPEGPAGAQGPEGPAASVTIVDGGDAVSTYEEG